MVRNCVGKPILQILCALLVGASQAGGIGSTTVDSAGPVIQFQTAADLGCAAQYQGDVKGQFYSDTACATVVAIDGSVYAPEQIPAGSGLTKVGLRYSPLTIAGNTGPSSIVPQTRTGSGSASDPYTITTSVRAGSRIVLTQSDQYVVGSQRISTTIQLVNPSATPVQVELFRVGDCYAQDSDFGFGQMAQESAACVSGNLARTVRFLATHRPGDGQPTASTFEGYYEDLWLRVATFGPGGARNAFNGSCRCADSIDNSAGLQWTLNVPGNGMSTVTSAVDFGPIATPGGLTLGDNAAPVQNPYGKAYVALGDSYSSGEGAGELENPFNYGYLSETDAENPKNRCHRSKNAYPWLIAKQFGLLGDESQNLDFSFRACSGAVTSDLFTANKSFEANPADRNQNEPAQVDAIGAETDLVTLTIGGNDANFSAMIKSCLAPRAFRQSDCKDQADATIRNYRALAAPVGGVSLLQTYQRIRLRMSPGASFVVFGYPDFTPFGDGCGTARSFSTEESKWLSDWIRTFNSLIERRAAWAGATYVDGDRLFQPINGGNHRICGPGGEWVNGLRGAERLSTSESFHPNRLGQKALYDSFYRRFVLGETNDDLSGAAPKVSLARVFSSAVPAASGVSTVVIRKAQPAAIQLDVVADRATVTSLSYDASAAPDLRLEDPAGTAVPIAPVNPDLLVSRLAGASSINVGATTALEIRQLPAGKYTLRISLPDSAPTAAGVLSVRTTSIADVNLAPVAIAAGTLTTNQRISANASGAVDPEGGPLTYLWSWGDKTSANGDQVTHQYRAPGRYTAELRVADEAGAATTQQLVVETRAQTFATVGLRRIGSSKLLVSVKCLAKLAVGTCHAPLSLVIRPRGGKASSVPVGVEVHSGKLSQTTVSLPGAKGRAFRGSISIAGRVQDDAVRGPQPVTHAAI